MTSTPQSRPPSLADRLVSFKTDCPAAGAPFPDVEAVTLDGAPWSIESLRGRVIVLETGSFT